MFLTNAVRDTSGTSMRHPPVDAMGRRGRNVADTIFAPDARRQQSASARSYRTSTERATGCTSRLWLEMEHRHGRRQAA